MTPPTGPAPTVTITANPVTIAQGSSSTLTVAATNATQVIISDNIDSTTYALAAAGGTQKVTPTATITYTATATGTGGTATAQTAVTVVPPGTVNSVNHVIFMMQENRTFDTYFGMLNPYRKANSLNVGDDGNTYNVDGIDDKLTPRQTLTMKVTSFPLFHTMSSCLDDMTSAWLESYGDVNRYDFLPSGPCRWMASSIRLKIMPRMAAPATLPAKERSPISQGSVPWRTTRTPVSQARRN